MTSDRNRAASLPDAGPALELALQQSHEVKAKVEACADDLAAVNSDVKQKIAEGHIMLPAHAALEDGESVEATVQECAADLAEVTDTLAQGIDDLKRVEATLARTRLALAETSTALSAALVDERAATHRAMHDSATGLPNRGLFDDRLAHGISLAARHDWTLAVMFLDLDRFKSINDDHGHAAGDIVLKEVAGRVSRFARDEDTFCRNGGDEFLYLLVNPKGRDSIERMAADVLDNIARPIDIGGGVEIVINSSIGIARYPKDGTTGDQLIANADIAMYRAKKRGCGWVLYARETEDAAG